MLTLLVSSASCSGRSNSSVSETQPETAVQETVPASETQPGTTAPEAADTEEQDETVFSGSKYAAYASMTPEEIVSRLTLEQKTAQMVQPAIYNVTEEQMKNNDYGSILSTVGCVDSYSWRVIVDGFQEAAVNSEAGIPYVYGQDDVQGVNYCLNAVYFSHNIGQGAANDEELAYQVGLITADEAKLCHMLWNFSPCVAQSVDPAISARIMRL